MTEQTRLTPQEELLEATDVHWGNYLSRLHSMPAEEQERYIRAQGYENLKDLLVHIGGWWRAALEAVQAFRTGNRYTPNWKDDAEFERRGIEQYKDVSLEQVEKELDDARALMSGVVSGLTVEEVNNPDIYGWLYRTVVRQYEEHNPSGEWW